MAWIHLSIVMSSLVSDFIVPLFISLWSISGRNLTFQNQPDTLLPVAEMLLFQSIKQGDSFVYICICEVSFILNIAFSSIPKSSMSCEIQSFLEKMSTSKTVPSGAANTYVIL